MRWVLLLAVVVAGACGDATAGWALVGHGSGAGKAKTLGSGSTPTASVSGRRATVSWAASTYTNGGTVAGYTIRRYNVGTGAGQAAANGCSGIVTALTCTETNVPGGSWQYTITPAAGNWRGTESAKGSIVF